MGRKFRIYAGRTGLRIINGQLVEFFRRNKSSKCGTKHQRKVRVNKGIRSICTDIE